MKDNFVLDVNIWISAIIGGRFHHLAQRIIEQKQTIYICAELVEELEDVLARPKIKKYLSQTVSFYIAEIKALATQTTIARKYNKAPDPDDNYLYDICLSTHSVLVTGDKLLLAHIAHPQVKTITMKDFLL